jgi:hypothetical protein
MHCKRSSLADQQASSTQPAQQTEVPHGNVWLLGNSVEIYCKCVAQSSEAPEVVSVSLMLRQLQPRA